jgi:hypothetical protein
MNKLILIIILITYFLASTITVDAYHRKRHKITSARKRHTHGYYHKRDEMVVSCTPPITTTCITTMATPLVCTPTGGSCDMKNPETCCSKGCALQTDGTFACCARTGDVFNCTIR